MNTRLVRDQVWHCWGHAKELGVVYVVERINYTYPASYSIERKSSGQSEYLGTEAATLDQAQRIIDADAARIKDTGEVHSANDQAQFREEQIKLVDK